VRREENSCKQAGKQASIHRRTFEIRGRTGWRAAQTPPARACRLTSRWC
jgi:hypothetical protein